MFQFIYTWFRNILVFIGEKIMSINIGGLNLLTWFIAFLVTIVLISALFTVVTKWKFGQAKIKDKDNNNNE